jgi:hypothetical protein
MLLMSEIWKNWSFLVKRNVISYFNLDLIFNKHIFFKAAFELLKLLQ